VSDSQGRSAQRFEMVVRARSSGRIRQAVAQGQDIYALSAPLVVEAAQRLLGGPVAVPGAVSLGEAFDAPGFLDALAPRHLAWLREG
jgi:hypothetical protein